jgi:hypothetical protein
MLKISVNEDIDDIKIKLMPINSEICIVHNRRKKDDFVVTFDSNLEFIKNQLSIISFEDFTEEKRIEFIMSDNDIVIAGRGDFLK